MGSNRREDSDETVRGADPTWWLSTGCCMQLNPPPFPSRRQMLNRFANGFGMLGVASLLAQDITTSPARAALPAHPLALKPPMFAARAKRVIFLFMSGGPSHVDLF